MGGLANTQAGQQIGAVQGLNQAQQNEQQALLGALGTQNNQNVAMQSNINDVNANIAKGNQAGQQQIVSGVAGGLGKALGLPSYADGGAVSGPSGVAGGLGKALGLAHGGQVPAFAPMMTNYADAGAVSGPTSNVGKWLTGGGDSAQAGSQALMNQSSKASDTNNMPPMQQAGQTVGKGIGAGIKGLGSLFGSGAPAAADATGAPAAADATGAMLAAHGGKVPAMVSPGEKYLSPKDVAKVTNQHVNPMQVGETIPGNAKVKGAKNSYANDTVPKTLDEGGIVLPRSVTKAKDPAAAASKFVAAIMAKKTGRLPKKS
jgi:hypothetical protein